ncbi:MAG: hypothetical protein GY882_10535 [Actinomycetia bacterium]|nr:hypothetical protein [Actinomycetes bacterium]MCP4845521.1 hypothetical protein [Actinomycetes bacterium]
MTSLYYLDTKVKALLGVVLLAVLVAVGFLAVSGASSNQAAPMSPTTTGASADATPTTTGASADATPTTTTTEEPATFVGEFVDAFDATPEIDVDNGDAIADEDAMADVDFTAAPAGLDDLPKAAGSLDMYLPALWNPAGANIEPYGWATATYAALKCGVATSGVDIADLDPDEFLTAEEPVPTTTIVAPVAGPDGQPLEQPEAAAATPILNTDGDVPMPMACETTAFVTLYGFPADVPVTSSPWGPFDSVASVGADFAAVMGGSAVTGSTIASTNLVWVAVGDVSGATDDLATLGTAIASAAQRADEATADTSTADTPTAPVTDVVVGVVDGSGTVLDADAVQAAFELAEELLAEQAIDAG